MVACHVPDVTVERTGDGSLIDAVKKKVGAGEGNLGGFTDSKTDSKRGS
jgi:hypothetical protein